MDDKTILSQLEEMAERLGIKVRYESLKLDGPSHAGAFCRINGEDVIFMNKKSATKEKIHLLIDTLKRHDLSDVYVAPALRKKLGIQDDQ